MTPTPFRRVLRGTSRLLRFRASGLDDVPGTPAGFLNSLAPLLAFPILGAFVMLVRGRFLTALGDLSVSFVALLGPPVLSHLLAQLWKREPAWLRYATAYNWCQVGAVIAFVPLVLVSSVPIMLFDLTEEVIPIVLVLSGVMFLYLLALNLFLIRRGLGLNLVRSFVFLLLVGCGSFALGRLPQLAVKLAGGMLPGS